MQQFGRRLGVVVSVSLALSACAPDPNDAPSASSNVGPTAAAAPAAGAAAVAAAEAGSAAPFAATDGGWSMSERDASSSYTVTPWGDHTFEATDMRFLPDGRALLIEKGGWDIEGTGKVDLLAPDGTFVRTILELPVCSIGERGLLGLEIDRAFDTNHLIYLFYTRQMSDCVMTDPNTFADGIANPVWNRVSSFLFDENGIDIASQRVLVDEFPGHSSAHNSGGLARMSDGTLLVDVGEGSYGRSAQLDFPDGKVLRIDPQSPDVPPKDNPFNTPGHSLTQRQVYATGFRNPFRIAVDPDSDLVALGDVGSETYEEVDIIKPGGFYGFPTVEGPGQNTGDLGPALWYKHEGGCISIIGGSFVPPAFLSATGGSWYTFSDLGCGGVWALSLDGSKATELVRLAGKMDVQAASLVWGPDNALYVIPIAPGAQKIRRLARS